MTIPVQSSLFGLNKLMARMEQVLIEACENDTKIADNPRKAMIAVWVSEGLKEVLDNRFETFYDFFMGCTTPETISRALRKLKADGRVGETEGKLAERRGQQDIWRRYMGNE
ncbi:unnamed protein product [marine sediment metagenome]|uniref:Uncharacterized protein n=1 Tax=marine sediment metagenome TaxID=412755 RepID=X1RTR8_9ZZZZ